MTDLRTAAQQALEALELEATSPPIPETAAAMDALRAALEQPEPIIESEITPDKDGPVAWIDDSGHPKHRLYWQSITEKRLYGPLRPLYTHPHRREWRELTDEEIDRVTDAQWASNNHKPIYEAHRAYARAIESALKERNA